MSARRARPRYQLRLYVAGTGAYTTAARENVARFADAAGIAVDLEVIDLLQHPEQSARDAVVVTPTLVKLSPLPRAMVIGDLADLRRMAAALGTSLNLGGAPAPGVGT